MKPEFNNSMVIARCPDCNGALSSFVTKKQGSEYGSIVIERSHTYKSIHYGRIIYALLSCSGCNRGGLAKVHCDSSFSTGALESFYPFSIEQLKLPSEIPSDIETEFREAEICIAYGARRGASALFRSTLEKILSANGYIKGKLIEKINEAFTDGVITESRKKKANENIRVLGNDVLHDAWREIDDKEVEDSHHYTQRILEDLYDDRKTVEDILKSKGRLP